VTNSIFIYIKKILKEKNPKKDVESWFSQFSFSGREYTQCNIIKEDFRDWINGGMNE